MNYLGRKSKNLFGGSILKTAQHQEHKKNMND